MLGDDPPHTHFLLLLLIQYEADSLGRVLPASPSPHSQEERVLRVEALPVGLVNNLLVHPNYSDAREAVQKFTGHGAEDSRADQFANEWGRSGKDPNHFRPAGLPKRY